MILSGKGAMVWQLRDWMRGDPVAQVEEAKRLNLRWLSVKVHNLELLKWDGRLAPGRQNWDLLPFLVPMMADAGIIVVAWGWIEGRTKATSIPPNRPWALQEAQACVQAMNMLVGLGGQAVYQVDAESKYKQSATRRDMGDQARTFMLQVKMGVPGIEMHLCSFKYPSLHSELPFVRFLEQCDGNSAQVYWEHESAVEAGVRNLDRSLREYDVIRRLPQVPIGPLYAAKNRTTGALWRATPEQIRAFLESAKARGCEGVGVWALDEATAEQVEAFRAFEWDVAAPPPPASPPTVPMAEWAKELDAWARQDIYSPYVGPSPQ